MKKQIVIALLCLLFISLAFGCSTSSPQRFWSMNTPIELSENSTVIAKSVKVSDGCMTVELALNLTDVAFPTADYVTVVKNEVDRLPITCNYEESVKASGLDFFEQQSGATVILVFTDNQFTETTQVDDYVMELQLINAYNSGIMDHYWISLE